LRHFHNFQKSPFKFYKKFKAPMVLVELVKPLLSEAHNHTLAFLEMGGQQSRLRTNSSSNDGENKVVGVPTRIDKFNDSGNAKNCWSFSNCHKLNERRNENEVYKPLHEPVIVSHTRAPLASVESTTISTTPKPPTSASTAAATITKQGSPTSLPSSSPSFLKSSEKVAKMEKHSNSSPSFVAGVMANTWKTGSVKRPENLPIQKSPQKKEEESIIVTEEREPSPSPLVKSPVSTISLYSDISSIRTSDVSPEYSLSEHSHDMLMHIIRCFPFSSSPKNSPKVVKRMDSKSSLPGCHTEPSSSHEYIEGSASLPLKKKHFTKHNPIGNLKNYFHYHHHNNNEKQRIRAESSVSENVAVHQNGNNSPPISPTGNGNSRPYALSTTSAPDSVIQNEHENGKETKKSALSRLCQVSVDTMAITALPLDCWLKERLKKWVQLSGHEGTIVPATNQTLWKKQPADNVIEAKAYEKIMKDPSLKGMTPKYYKEIEHKNESFIEIQDLLADFPNTSTRAIMDIKIGTRTFLESEVANSSKRKDLYKKMVDIDPNEPTEEEKADEAITKLRYMQFRERESSSASLGFRIEAAQLPGGKLQKSFKKVKTAENVLQTLKEFLGDRVEKASKELEQRLREMRTSIENSDFFKSHEVVGSSILIIYDEEKSGAWMIDFAKSKQVPENIQLNHRREWEVGNHEDGYLHGLDNLIEILSKCHS
jgi:1D-myo-inositol-triphosphate 3-kinase